MVNQLLRIDGVFWDAAPFSPVPYCPAHRIEMETPGEFHDSNYDKLICPECDNPYAMPRDIAAEKSYIKRKANSLALKTTKVLNLDDEAIPLAEANASSADGKFFVTAVLTKSKVGQRLVVYAGEQGKKEKTQVFVEPEIKRLAFDQKDLNPSEVFVKFEAIFADGFTISGEQQITKD